MEKIFITGGTGYIGSRLIPRLLQSGFEVHALARKSSAARLPEGCKVVIGDALNAFTFRDQIHGCHTFIHMIGVAHPNPTKTRQFREIDLVSIQASVEAAKQAGIKHFIYISVAQGSAVMKEYQSVRAEGERLLKESGMNVTVIRPWYVLGPGHYWPVIMLPFLKLLELIPFTRQNALRIGIVTINQMLNTLVHAAKNPAVGFRIIEIPEIRRMGL